MRSFRVAGAGLITAEFDPVEAALLTQLTNQVAEILGAAQANLSTPDPAVLRLLPDAYPDDSEASAEFRRFTASGLTESKVRNAAVVKTDLSPVLAAEETTEISLDPQSTQAWVRALTDVRLVLATRLGITKDEDVPRESEEALLLGDVYDWLGWVQESLVEAMED